tara:strand:- start:46 stop:195 length:150 start_codon:yes stop_codon:yes gene_type:complete
MKKITSWGRNKFIKTNFYEPETRENLKYLIKKKIVLYLTETEGLMGMFV